MLAGAVSMLGCERISAAFAPQAFGRNRPASPPRGAHPSCARRSTDGGITAHAKYPRLVSNRFAASAHRAGFTIRPRRTNAAESVVLMVRYRIDFRVNGCTLIASRIGAARLCPKFTANYGAEAVATGIEYVRLERVLHAG